MLDDLDSGSAIAAEVSRLLRVADVKERLPTPVDDLVAAADLRKVAKIDIDEAMVAAAPTAEMRRILGGAMRKIRGLLDRRERVIQIQPTEFAGRERFVTCHEIAHDIFPWQRDLAVLGDTSQTLSADVTAMFEREANAGGAQLLFQLEFFDRVAADYPIDLSTPIELAELFGASIHSTFRRWVEGIDAPVCGLVTDVKLSNGRRRRYEQIESKLWRQRFGTRRFPWDLAVERYPFASALFPRSGVFELADVDGSPTQLQVEVYATPYRRFVLLWVPTRRSFVARHRRRPIIVAG